MNITFQFIHLQAEKQEKSSNENHKNQNRFREIHNTFANENGLHIYAKFDQTQKRIWPADKPNASKSCLDDFRKAWTVGFRPGSCEGWYLEAKFYARTVRNVKELETALAIGAWRLARRRAVVSA